MYNLDVAIYLRKSRADVDEENKALERGETYDTLGKHRRELLAVAKRDHHNVLDIYEELVSGEYIASRPAMQQLLENVHADKYEAVLVVDIDRLGRGNKLDQGRLENAFRDSATLIITPSQIFDLTQEDGEFGVEVRTFLANMEYRSIKRRLQRGLLNAAAQGKDIGGPPPFGFRKDEQMHLIIYEPEADVIRRIFQWCVDGVGVRFISKRLEAMGIPSPSGKPYWGHTMIKRVISNKKYMGTMTFGSRQHIKKEDGSYRIRPKRDDSKYIEVPDAHIGIVSADLFEQAQAAMKKRDPKVNQDKRLVYPLAGLVRCAKCGRMLRCQFPANRKPHGYLYCGNDRCTLKGIRLDHVENAVIAEISSILERIRLTDEDLPGDTLANERAAITGHIEHLKKEIERDTARKGKVYESYEEGIYTKEMFLERLNTLQERMRKQQNEIMQQQHALDHLEERARQQTKIMPFMTDILKVYHLTESAADKNQLLKAVIREIVYNREPSNQRNTIDDFELEIKLLE